MQSERTDFLSRYGKIITAENIRKSVLMPFKDQTQFPILLDALSRQNKHHMLLSHHFSDKMLLPFIEAFVEYLSHNHIPPKFRHPEIIYLDVKESHFSITEQLSLEHDFQKIYARLEGQEKFTFFVFSDALFLRETLSQQSGLKKYLMHLLDHPKSRVIVFTQQNAKEQLLIDRFCSLDIEAPSFQDHLNLTKLYKIGLETYHHVNMNEDILPYALTLVERYFPPEETFDQTLLLLDSAASRALAQSHSDPNAFRPTVTITHVLAVLSNWTHIPTTHLNFQHLRINELAQGLNEKIFGQEQAISVMSETIQRAQSILSRERGVLLRLFLVGAKFSGKKNACIALAEQLFKNKNLLYIAHPQDVPSVMDIKLHALNRQESLSLKTLIKQMPYAMVAFEDIEKWPLNLILQIQEVALNGLFLENETIYHFEQMIFMLTTTLAAEYLSPATQAVDEEDHLQLNLMQLVLQEESNPQADQETFSELKKKLLAVLKNHLPENLCDNVPIVPFYPLNLAATEKIVALKLKTLSKQLDMHYKVELTYAPEVIRYLATDFINKQQQTENVHVSAEMQQLYFMIEQAILNQPEQKNRPTQLFLQLNETGQLLRCDWLMMNAIRHL